ncbi:hypothetical protein FRB96_008393 [Tulasnella sp. 330]|nr:hypothetical protein FRB96_008393 [Tulasnella sp. 330]
MSAARSINSEQPRPSFRLTSSSTASADESSSDYSSSAYRSSAAKTHRPSHSYSNSSAITSSSSSTTAETSKSNSPNLTINPNLARSTLQSTSRNPTSSLQVKPSYNTLTTVTTRASEDALASSLPPSRPKNAALGASPAVTTTAPAPAPGSKPTHAHSSSSWKLEIRGLTKFVKWGAKGNVNATATEAGTNPSNTTSNTKDSRKASKTAASPANTSSSRPHTSPSTAPEPTTQNTGLFRRATWSRHLSANNNNATTAAQANCALAPARNTTEVQATESIEQDMLPLPSEIPNNTVWRGHSLDTAITSIPRPPSPAQRPVSLSSVSTRSSVYQTPTAHSVRLPSSSSKTSTPRPTLRNLGLGAAYKAADKSSHRDSEDVSTTRTAKSISKTNPIASSASTSTGIFDPRTAQIASRSRRHLPDDGKEDVSHTRPRLPQREVEGHVTVVNLSPLSDNTSSSAANNNSMPHASTSLIDSTKAMTTSLPASGHLRAASAPIMSFAISSAAAAAQPSDMGNGHGRPSTERSGSGDSYLAYSHPWTLSPAVEEEGFDLDIDTDTDEGGMGLDMRLSTIVDLQSKRSSGRSGRSRDSQGQDLAMSSAGASGSGSGSHSHPHSLTGNGGESSVNRYSHSSTAVASSELGHSAAAASTLVHQTVSELGHGYYGGSVTRAGSGKRAVTTGGISRRGSGRKVIGGQQHQNGGAPVRRKASTSGGGAKRQIAGRTSPTRRSSPPRSSKHQTTSATSVMTSTTTSPTAPLSRTKSVSMKERFLRSFGTSRRNPVTQPQALKGQQAPSSSSRSSTGGDPRLLNKAKQSNISIHTSGNGRNTPDGLGRLQKKASKSLLSFGGGRGASKVSLSLDLTAEQFRMSAESEQPQPVAVVAKAKVEKPPLPNQPPPARLLKRPKSAVVTDRERKESLGKDDARSKPANVTKAPEAAALATFANGLGLQLDSSEGTAAAGARQQQSRQLPHRPSPNVSPYDYLLTPAPKGPSGAPTLLAGNFLSLGGRRRGRKLSKRGRGESVGAKVVMTDRGDDGVILDIGSGRESQDTDAGVEEEVSRLAKLMGGRRARSSVDLLGRDELRPKTATAPRQPQKESLSQPPRTGSTGTSTTASNTFGTPSDVFTPNTSPATSPPMGSETSPSGSGSRAASTSSRPITAPGFFRRKSTSKSSSFKLSLYSSSGPSGTDKKEGEKDEVSQINSSNSQTLLQKRKSSLNLFIDSLSGATSASKNSDGGKRQETLAQFPKSDQLNGGNVSPLPHVLPEPSMAKVSLWEELGVGASYVSLEDSKLDRPVRGPITQTRLERVAVEAPLPLEARGKNSLADTATKIEEFASAKSAADVLTLSPSELINPISDLPQATFHPPKPLAVLAINTTPHAPSSSIVEPSSGLTPPSSSTAAPGARLSSRRAPLISLVYTGRQGYEQERAARTRRSARNSPASSTSPLQPLSSIGQPLHAASPPVSFPFVSDRDHPVSSRPSSIGYSGAPVSTLLYTSPSSPAFAQKNRGSIYFDALARTSYDDLAARGAERDRPQPVPLQPHSETVGLKDSDDLGPLPYMQPSRPSLQHRPSSNSARRWTLAVNHIADDGDFLKEIDALKRTREESDQSLIYSDESAEDQVDEDEQLRQRDTYLETDDCAEEEDERVWLKARRAMLCVREMIRTESNYRRHLSRIFEMESNSPSSTAPIAFIDHLPILISASMSFSALLEEDPSAWGVSAAFLGVEDEIEKAMVSWCHVVGEVMMELMSNNSTPATPWYTRRPSIKESSKEASQEGDKEEKRALKRSETGGSSDRSSSGHIVKFVKKDKPPKTAPPSSATSPALVGPPRSKALNIQDVAIMPSQRVPRYVLLFKDLLQQTPITSPSRALVERALEGALRIAKNCDAAQQNEGLAAAS